jgi:uncharacterized RDD family membrane protein YckC
MTTGDYDPNNPPQPGAYPPPPPPPPQYGQQQGGYAPPPPPPQYGQQQGGFPPPPPGGYPPPPAEGGYPPPPQYGAAPSYGYPGQGPVGGAQPGSLGIRFAARLIDSIIVSVVSWIIAFAVSGDSYVYVGGILAGLLTFGYFVGFEVSQGWTPAKKIFGLSVQGPGGAPKPDFKQSAIRNSFTLLPIIPFIGSLLAFIAEIVIAVTINSSPTKQGKHDELAGGTQVIKS